MILKRIYFKKKKYPYYFHPEIGTFHEFIDFANKNPKIKCWDLDNAEYVISDLSHDEQEYYWSNSIKNIMFNTRWVLDNLEYLNEFKVRWNQYGNLKSRRTVGKPPLKYNKLCEKLYNRSEELKMVEKTESFIKDSSPI